MSKPYPTLLDLRSQLIAAECRGDGQGALNLRRAIEEMEAETENLPHAKPGQFCPTCGEQHCSRPEGHEWDDNSYCVHCGADGRA